MSKCNCACHDYYIKNLVHDTPCCDRMNGWVETEMTLQDKLDRLIQEYSYSQVFDIVMAMRGDPNEEDFSEGMMS